MKPWGERLVFTAIGALLGTLIARVTYLHFDGIDWPKTSKAINELAQTIAIIIGGVWTYWLFIAQRSHKPKVVLENKVQFIEIGPETILVRVKVCIKNEGRVLLTPRLVSASIQQIAPITTDTCATFPSDTPHTNWPEIQRIDIDCREESVTLEPAEIETYDIDFVATLPVTHIQLSTVVYTLPPDAPPIEGDITVDKIEERDDVTLWDETTLHEVLLIDSNASPIAPA